MNYGYEKVEKHNHFTWLGCRCCALLLGYLCRRLYRSRLDLGMLPINIVAQGKAHKGKMRSGNMYYDVLELASPT